MAPHRNNQKDKKVAVSFDEFIQADRKKRKAEELAQQIMGKNRNSNNNTPSAGNRRSNNQTAAGSFASRVGVTKAPSQSRTPTLANNDKRQNDRDRRQNNHDRRQINRAPESSIYNSAIGAASSVSAPALAQPQPTSDRHYNDSFASSEINIRGAAGPYCVVGTNFAPGTTTADIQSVMVPVGGEMLSCKLISTQPTVTVEMVFFDRAGAENIIAAFNNKKADGRILYFYMKEGGPTYPIAHVRPTQFAATTPIAPSPRPQQQQEQEQQQQLPEDTMEVDADAFPVDNANFDVDVNVSVEPEAPAPAQAPPSNDAPRAPRDPNRSAYRDDYPRDYRREDRGHPGHQDGRYGGFQGQSYARRGGYGNGWRGDRRPRFGNGGRNYSDSVVDRSGGDRYYR